MVVSDAQVEKLMKEIGKGRPLSAAALAAGMDRKTARKYATSGKLPSEMRAPRTWRTREDPFEQDWPWVAEQLQRDAGLDAKTLFEELQDRYPGRYGDGQLRTLQRRVRQWRATDGPDKEVFFPQEHRPGEAGQSDFTHCSDLQVTIQGEPLAHMFAHFVLPYSNWEWATVCQSESLTAITRGVQASLGRLRRKPTWHQTDNSTAATHHTDDGRAFNAEYIALMKHVGMKPRTTAVGAKEQNGDVESAHRAFKRRVDQRLRLRGSRDFDSPEQYEAFVQAVATRANANRKLRLDQELAVMDPYTAKRLPEFKEFDPLVTSWSTIRVLRNTYSVPSRLIGERVRVRAYDHELHVYLGGVFQLRVERLLGREQHRINYRHVIWWLVRKPGAFARYRYREDLYPTPVFRRAYDEITAAEPGLKGDLEYLRILHHAAATLETDVEAALIDLHERRLRPTADLVRALTGTDQVEVPQLQIPAVDLRSYDSLLTEGGHR